MKSPSWSEGGIRGELTISAQEIADKLNNILKNDYVDEFPCFLEKGNESELKINDELIIKFTPPRAAIGFIFKNIEHLLENNEISSGVSKRKWYVLEEDTASWESGKELNKKLATVGKLVKTLSSSATVFNEKKSELIFINGARFDISINYSEAFLDKLDADLIEKIYNSFQSEDVHLEQKRQIYATSICSMLVNTSIDERFSKILDNLDELKRNYDDGYKLFASSFSFDKIKDEAEALRIEYSTKIHKTISDIHSQILGIPIATVVVASQFKEVTSSAHQIWINIAVMFGATIFCFVLFFAIINQWHTLSLISTEIDRQRKSFEKQNRELADRFSSKFDDLNNRIFWHHVALAFILSTAATAWVFSLGVFWLISKVLL
ncbi:hypothetical protein [Comamonas sp. C24C]